MANRLVFSQIVDTDLYVKLVQKTGQQKTAPLAGLEGSHLTGLACLHMNVFSKIVDHLNFK